MVKKLNLWLEEYLTLAMENKYTNCETGLKKKNECLIENISQIARVLMSYHGCK